LQHRLRLVYDSLRFLFNFRLWLWFRHLRWLFMSSKLLFSFYWLFNFIRWFGALDLTWQLGHQVSKTVHLHPSVNLPDLTAVHDPGQAMATLKSLKEDIRAGRANLVIKRHPKLQNWLSKLNKERGKSYTDTTFLSPEDRKEMQKVIAEIKAEGGTPVTVYHNLISFPVPDDIAAKDIPKFILEAKEIRRLPCFLL